MPLHNKLVRDLIPTIIKNSGKKFSIRILNDTEYIKELNKKSLEELNEYLEADNSEDAIEELADMMEVIYAIAEYHGASIEILEEVRREKAEKRGGFKGKIYLIEVEDE